MKRLPYKIRSQALYPPTPFKVYPVAVTAPYFQTYHSTRILGGCIGTKRPQATQVLRTTQPTFICKIPEGTKTTKSEQRHFTGGEELLVTRTPGHSGQNRQKTKTRRRRKKQKKKNRKCYIIRYALNYWVFQNRIIPQDQKDMTKAIFL